MFFLTFFTAVGATLSVSELFPMAGRRVVFTTVRGVNVIEQRTMPVDGEITIDENVPIVYFGEQQVIIGSPSALKTPSPQGELVYLNRDTWAEDFSRSVLANPDVKGLFPASTFGILYSRKSESTINITDLQKISSLVASLNSRIDPKFKSFPVPFLSDMRPGQVGIN